MLSLVSRVTPLPELTEEEKQGFDPRGKAYGVIYRATNWANGKRYIGLTISTLDQRKASHFWCARHRKSHFGSAIMSHGQEAFDWEIIDSALSKEELDQLEIYWIQFYRSNDRAHGYNLEGGGNGKGVVAESTKAKLSELAKERIKNNGHPMLGKTRSPEEVAKISNSLKKGYEEGRIIASNLGKKFSQETKNKISNAKKTGYLSGAILPPPNRGKAMSQEQRQKLTIAHGGSNPQPTLSGPPKGSRNSIATEFPAQAIQCVETGLIFPSLSAAARYFDIGNSNFVAYFKGTRKSVVGYQWIKVAG